MKKKGKLSANTPGLPRKEPFVTLTRLVFIFIPHNILYCYANKTMNIWYFPGPTEEDFTS